MKRFLSALIAVVAFPFAVSAQTGLSSTIFTNFNKLSFTVDLSAAPTNKIKINLDSGSDVTTYINDVVGGGTNGFNFWKYDTNTGVLSPSINPAFVAATNVLAYGLYAERELMLVNQGAVTLALGANDVAVAGRNTISVNGTTTTADDSLLNIDNGNGFGQLLILRNNSTNQPTFTMHQTQVQTGDATKTNRLKGDWIPQTRGESLWLWNDGFGFVEVDRTDAVTDFGVTTNIFQNIVVTNLTAYSITVTQAISHDRINISSNYISINGTNLATINPTDLFIPYRINTNNFGDSSFKQTASDHLEAFLGGVKAWDFGFPNLTNVLEQTFYELDPSPSTLQGINMNFHMKDNAGTERQAFQLSVGRQNDWTPGNENSDTIFWSSYAGGPFAQMRLLGSGIVDIRAPYDIGTNEPTSSLVGLEVATGSAASNGNQKNSPAVIWRGAGWDVGGSQSKSTYIGAYQIPRQTLTEPVAVLTFHAFTVGGVDQTVASIDGNSGYDGSGTHFLSDDGTYKTAGGGPGGSSLWTNLALAFQPIAQYTNFYFGADIFASGTNNGQNITLLGNRAAYQAIFDSATHDVFGAGYYPFRASVLQGASDVSAIGQNSLATSYLTNFADGHAWGNYALFGLAATNSSNIYGKGHSAGQGVVATASGNLFFDGNESGLSSSFTNSFDISAFNGAFKGASFTNSANIIGLLVDAGKNTAFSNSWNLLLIGTNSTAALGAHDQVIIGGPTGVFVDGNENQFTVGTPEALMPSQVPFGDILPSVGDNRHFISTTDLLDDATTAALSVYGYGKNPFSAVEGLNVAAFATNHDCSIVAVSGNAYYDGGTNRTDGVIVGVQGISSFISCDPTTVKFWGGDFHYQNMGTNAMSEGSALYLEDYYNPNGGVVTNNYGLNIPDRIGGINNIAIHTGLGRVEFGDAFSAGTTNRWQTGDYVTGGKIRVNVNTTNYNLLTDKAVATIAPVTLSYGAGGTNIVTDASLGNHFRLTATNTLFLANPINPTDGQKIIWEIIQDGVGSRSATEDTEFAFGTDITGITLTTTASKRDFITAIYNGTATKWYVTGFVRGY